MESRGVILLDPRRERPTRGGGVPVPPRVSRSVSASGPV